MLFGVTYKTPPGGGEERQERSLQVFTEWTPPDGLEIHAHYFRADGNGGLAIVEADSAEVVAEGIAPFTPFFEYEVAVLLEAESAVPILQSALQWRESLR